MAKTFYTDWPNKLFRPIVEAGFQVPQLLLFELDLGSYQHFVPILNSVVLNKKTPVLKHSVFVCIVHYAPNFYMHVVDNYVVFVDKAKRTSSPQEEC